MTRKYAPHANYMLDLLAELRQANEKVHAASAKWKKESDRVDRHCARQGLSKWERVKDRKADIDLTGAMDDLKFWRDEVMRVSATITAEYQVREMIKVRAKGTDNGSEHIASLANS